MRKFKLIKPTLLIASLALLFFLVGSLAYFTDREETGGSLSTVKKGVDIQPEPDPSAEPDDPDNPNKPGGDKDPKDYEDPTPNDPSDDLENWWMYLNSRATVNFNPGDKMTLSYILANQGDLAVDVRETFIITSSVPLSAVPEFRLYTAVDKDDAGAFYGIAANVVSNETAIPGADGTYIYKYTVNPYILSSEAQLISKDEGNNYPIKIGREYFLVFAATAGNEFQAATCTVEYIVEAKQHTDGGEEDWVIATTASVTLPVSGQTIPVVSAAP